MSVLDKFLDAIRLNDDYEEEDADSDSFFDEEDDDIEEKPKKRNYDIDHRVKEMKPLFRFRKVQIWNAFVKSVRAE